MIPRNRYSNSYPAVPHISISRSLVFGTLIVVALIAFEIFNFSTTEFALRDIFGGLKFVSIPWATILAIAFCGIDFAGLARMFTPEVGADEPREVWYLFGAWMLAAMMNAILTWWGVAIAINNHETLGNGIVARRILLQGVPVFVAIMVWLIRVLIIGTFSVTGERLFGNKGTTNSTFQTGRAQNWQPTPMVRTARSLTNRPTVANLAAPYQRLERSSRPVKSQRPDQTHVNSTYHPESSSPKTTAQDLDPENEPAYIPADPVYVPVGMTGRSQGGNHQVRM